MPTDPNAPPQDRLSSRRAYSAGQVVFDPPPASAHATRNRAAAMQKQAATEQATGMYNNLQPSNGEAKFALYTDLTGGTNGVHPAQRPVWIVTFHNVPDVASGGGRTGPGSGTSPPATELHDIVYIIDDATGSLDSVISGVLD